MMHRHTPERMRLTSKLDAQEVHHRVTKDATISASPPLRICISPKRRFVSQPTSDVRTPLVTGSLRTSPALSSASSDCGDRSPHAHHTDIICVVDPASRKLEIPRSLLQETQVLNRVGIPSLCMLFLKGKCRAGTRCHQAHVEAHVVEDLRAHVRSAPTCCHEHGDLHSKSLIQQLSGCRFWLAGQMVPIAKFAATLGLQRLAAEAQESTFARRSLDAALNAEFPRHSAHEGDAALLEEHPEEAETHTVVTNVMLVPRNVCRLHVAGRCRYVEECNHVHLCRSMPGLSETARRGESQRLPRENSSTASNDATHSHQDARFSARRRAGSLGMDAHSNARILPDPTAGRHPLMKYLDERNQSFMAAKAQAASAASHAPTTSSASSPAPAAVVVPVVPSPFPTRVETVKHSHNPYQYKVLNEYQYLSAGDVDKMVCHHLLHS